MIKRFAQSFLFNVIECNKRSLLHIKASTPTCYFHSPKEIEVSEKIEKSPTKNELPEKISSRTSLRSITNDQENIILVHNLSKEWDETTIKKILKLDDESEILKVTLIKDRLGLFSGKAFLTLKDRETAERYIKKYDQDWVQHEDTVQKLQVRFFELKKNKEKEVFKKNLREVCVFNLNYNCTYDDLLSFAKYFGAVDRIKLPVKMDGKNKGYAFVTFLSAEDAQNFVMDADEMDFMDRKVRIKFARDAKERSEGEMKRKGDELLRNIENDDIKIKNQNLLANMKFFGDVKD